MRFILFWIKEQAGNFLGREKIYTSRERDLIIYHDQTFISFKILINSLYINPNLAIVDNFKSFNKSFK